jgi:hypothetical protein
VEIESIHDGYQGFLLRPYLQEWGWGVPTINAEGYSHRLV